MSVYQMSLVWRHAFEKNELLVMLALADHAHDDGTHIFPSVEHVAWKTGLSERSVQRHLSSLRERGVLVVEREATRYDPTDYSIDWSQATRKPQPPKRNRRGDKTSPRSEPGVTTGALRGDTTVTPGVTPASPKPSVQPSREPSTPPTPRAVLATRVKPADVEGEEAHVWSAAKAHPQAFDAWVELYADHRQLLAQLARLKTAARAPATAIQEWLIALAADASRKPEHALACVRQVLATATVHNHWGYYRRLFDSTPASVPGQQPTEREPGDLTDADRTAWGIE